MITFKTNGIVFYIEENLLEQLSKSDLRINVLMDD